MDNSHHHCQNQPDPDHPPESPSGHHQAHVDAKIRDIIGGIPRDRTALQGAGGGAPQLCY